MRIKHLRIRFLLPLIAVFLFSCGEDEAENDAQYDSTKVVVDENNIEDVEKKEVSIVCMWGAVSLKETPTTKGKYITTIYLGEVASTFGEIVTDSSTSKVRDFVKIKLGDGTEGWIQENLMAIDATSHVIKSNTKLYKRPDILTAGTKEFDRMQFVAVTEMQEGWMKVKGKKQGAGWFSEGWVKSSNLTSLDLDVAVAVLANRAMGIGDKDKKIDALKEIVENSDFASSQFIIDVEEMIENLSIEEAESDSGISDTEGE